MIATRLVTAEEFAERTLGDAIVELIEGEICELSPTKFLHGVITSLVQDALTQYGKKTGAVKVYSGEVGYVLGRNPDSVLSPDIVVLTREQDAAGRRNIGAFANFAPLLVVEVKSPSDREADIARKLGIYLSAGVCEVWWIRPETRQATLYRTDRDPVVIDASGSLESQELLPGFSLPLAELFAD